MLLSIHALASAGVFRPCGLQGLRGRFREFVQVVRTTVEAQPVRCAELNGQQEPAITERRGDLESRVPILGTAQQHVLRMVGHRQFLAGGQLLADGLPYCLKHRRMQMLELLDGDWVVAFVRCLGRNVDAHFGFSFRFMLRRAPTAYGLIWVMPSIGWRSLIMSW